MTTSVLVPFTSGCEWRERAWDYVRDRYAQEHPDWQVVVGVCAGPWSKGAALHDAASRADGAVLVIADADSFVDAAVLNEAVRIVEGGESAWVVPHRKVWRYTEPLTLKVYAGCRPRTSGVVRRPYTGVKGGGITVVSRSAWDAVGGIDERFEGWGGEDIAFGWALETLCGPCVRLEADLHHLYHPHAAPSLRGSPASEALAGKYRDAHRVPRLMRALIERRPPEQPVELARPAVFRSRTPNLIARNGRNVVARFRSHAFTTTDPDIAAVLRLLPRIEEVTPHEPASPHADPLHDHPASA